MITEIRNKITTIGETVTSNFFYRNAGANKSQPRCVYDFFGNEILRTTKDEGQHFYFQVACYQRTDALCESLCDSVQTALLNTANWTDGTTNFNFIEIKKMGRRSLSVENEVKEEKCLIIEFYLWMESK